MHEGFESEKEMNHPDATIEEQVIDLVSSAIESKYRFKILAVSVPENAWNELKESQGHRLDMSFNGAINIRSSTGLIQVFK